MIKLSVIIPVYNGSDFIEKSIDTIENQNLSNFEVVYINNNSSDNTVELIEEKQKSKSYVLLFHEKKQGAAAARNTGIKKSKGKYLYFLDVDDEVYPNAINDLIAVLDENKNLDMVFGKMIKSTHSISHTPLPEIETNKLIIKSKPYWGLKWFKDLKTVVGPPAFLYRRETILEIGGYNEHIHICEDTALDIELGMTKNIGFLDRYIYLYFKHPNSSIQLNKKEGGSIFILWERLIRSHLMFYLNHDVPHVYKEHLFKQLYSSMGKMVCYTNGFKNRQKIITKIKLDIGNYVVPPYLKTYLYLLSILPSKMLLKAYVHYLSPWYVNKNLKSF